MSKDMKMSKEMKMSDVFTKINKPMVKRAIFNSCSNQAASNEQAESMDFVLCAATHAVLNHDRITEENKRLREALLLVLDAACQPYSCSEDTCDMVNQLLSELGGE